MSDEENKAGTLIEPEQEQQAAPEQQAVAVEQVQINFGTKTDLRYEPVFENLDGLNQHHLKRKNAFQGTDKLEQQNIYRGKKSKETMSFADAPNVLPVQLKPMEQKKAAPEQQLLQPEQQAEESKGRTIDWNLPFFDTVDNFESIKQRSIEYTKPLFIIYNPHSGQQLNLIPPFEKRLTEEKIPYEVKATEAIFDTFKIPYHLDFDKYSALIVIGGDGSIHEVLNGMLMRKDGKRLPIGLVPGGSGNDGCRTIGISEVNDALDYIIQKKVMKFDLVRVLADHDSVESLPEPATDDNVLDFCRYSQVNICFSMPAMINRAAIPYKKCCGAFSYTLATLKIACSCGMIPDLYEMELDGKKITDPEKENNSTIAMFIQNGSFGGGGMVLNPYAFNNDGLLDVMWMSGNKNQGLLGIAGTMDDAKKGGIHAYKEGFTFMRGQQMKLTIKGRDHKKQYAEGTEHETCVDGEAMFFKNYVKMEVLPSSIEYLFDAKAYFAKTQSYQ